tara:strand:- start:80 stop:196 length:117 start_codon:yes stop_codon:yes gene_type:complete
MPKKTLPFDSAFIAKAELKIAQAKLKLGLPKNFMIILL